MNISKLLDSKESIETEETLREICRISDISRQDVLVRDSSSTNFVYDNTSELVLVTLAVMLETSESQLIIDVVNDNQRKKRRENFISDKVVTWEFPYKAHNKGHGNIAFREYYVKRKQHNFTIDDLMWHRFEEPLVIHKDTMFVKFSHNFDHELLHTIANWPPDTRNYFNTTGRLFTKQILSKNGQTVRGNSETGTIYRTKFLGDPDFRDIWNKSLECITKARRLKITRDEYGNIESENNLLMYDFVLDFDKQCDTPIDVTHYKPFESEYSIIKTRITHKIIYKEGHIQCLPTALGCVMYLPPSATDSFYIVGYHQDTQKRSLWEHEVSPGEAIFLSNKVRFELLNFDQQFQIYGFNIVGVCDVYDPGWTEGAPDPQPDIDYVHNLKLQQINSMDKSRRTK